MHKNLIGNIYKYDVSVLCNMLNFKNIVVTLHKYTSLI